MVVTPAYPSKPEDAVNIPATLAPAETVPNLNSLLNNKSTASFCLNLAPILLVEAFCINSSLLLILRLPVPLASSINECQPS